MYRCHHPGKTAPNMPLPGPLLLSAVFSIQDNAAQSWSASRLRRPERNRYPGLGSTALRMRAEAIGAARAETRSFPGTWRGPRAVAGARWYTWTALERLSGNARQTEF